MFREKKRTREKDEAGGTALHLLRAAFVENINRRRRRRRNARTFDDDGL